MRGFTGNKDTDRLILLNLSDRDFLKSCNVNSYFRNTVCDDTFFKRRLEQTYPSTIRYKDENETWKEYFLNVIYHIGLLYEKHDFEYEEGNPMTQYEIFEMAADTVEVEGGHYAIVKYLIGKGASITPETL